MKAYYGSAISDNIVRTPAGYLICKNVPIARTGFQEYRASELGLGADDGYTGQEIVKVYRDSEEVFHPATLASFEGVTVTSPHPSTFLNESNDRGYHLGHVQNVRRGPQLDSGEHAIIADLFLKDSQLIDAVETNRLREVSAGYDCMYERIGDRVFAQKQIRGNHVAVIPSGRCGPDCQIMDCACQKPKGEEEQMEEGKSVWKRFKDELADAGEVFKLLGWKQPTADSDPGAVERNANAAAEALERAKKRNEDSMEKETADAKAQSERLGKVLDSMESFLKKQEARDAEEEKEKEKKEKEMKDAEEKEKKEAEDRKSKDAEKEEKEKKDKEESEDADLIPVETMTGNEVPKNPIPGADAALAKLRAIQPLIAKSKDRKMIDAFNDAVRAIKGKTADGDDSKYADLMNGKKPEGVDTFDAGADKNKAAAVEFIDVAAQFHRKNPGEVKIEKRGTK